MTADLLMPAAPRPSDLLEPRCPVLPSPVLPSLVLPSLVLPSLVLPSLALPSLLLSRRWCLAVEPGAALVGARLPAPGSLAYSSTLRRARR